MKPAGLLLIARAALTELWAHRIRSLLTVLGVAIGIWAVIAISAIIHGLNANVMERAAALGSRSFFAAKQDMSVRFGRPSAAERQRKDFTYEDVDTLRRLCREVELVSPFLTARSLFGDRYIVKYRDQRAENPIIRGVEDTFAATMGTVQVAEGRFFAPGDSERGAQLTVLGHAIARALFPMTDPIGRQIRINAATFTVIGTLEHQEGLFGGFSEDNYVLIPFGTFRRLWPEVKDIAIAFAVSDPGRIPAGMDEVEHVLRLSRRVRPNAPSDFSLFTANFLNDLWRELTFALFAITIAVASIGLMVGGIGVMNIMLVSVRERTREIGVRKAVGASRADIMAQFLVEAVTLTGLGGLVGILAAAALTLVLRQTVPELPAEMSAF